MKIEDATLRQNAAADPDRSTWLSANAGSGKTRVLTDRVARLLLRGVQPQNILCLTYTKAAASEMQNRLFSTLGSWAMVEEDELRSKLEALGEDPRDDLDAARRLFAGAIEAPGGLKIQTIHSFCSVVLRQFPLEAQVSPQFRELDEFGQKALIEQVLDELAEDPSFAGVARFYSEQDLVSLGMDVAGKRAEFAKPLNLDQVFSRFGVPKDQKITDVLGLALPGNDWEFLRGLVPEFLQTNNADLIHCAKTIANSPENPNRATLLGLEWKMLYGDGAAKEFQPRIGRFPKKDFRENSTFSPNMPRLETIMQQVSDARRARIALEAAQKTAALHDFASVFLPAYEQAKSDQGVLDFDDLIQKAAHLLSDKSLAWVLYRLDGSIDHILIDEAQDTSPAQWSVITSISDEITAGQGSRENHARSVFVVGDKKQSIYSFQGADAEGFDRMSETFDQKLKDGPGLHKRELLHSFRSSPAILSAVDHSFDDPLLRGLGDQIQHEAFHKLKPGRVDVWDLVPNAGDLDEPEWFDPRDRVTISDPAVVLSNQLAAEIRRLIENETIRCKNGDIRRIEPRDILILVQKRSEIFHQIIRACKAFDLPIAGADRLKLGGVLAVKDLLALLSFLALPNDSLSLATVLKSPLFGWSEQDLYSLAHGRKQPLLWAELRTRADEYPDTIKILTDLRNVVDHLRPYELLERILLRHQGRRKLVGRLGAEAEDGIDELLNQALGYEREAVPTLTGFLVKAQSEDIVVKRQADSTGNLIRVMTVHGAKGLESPIVFLPDTTPGANQSRSETLIDPDGVPVWPVKTAESPDLIKRAKEVNKEAEKQERNRLLYVAMTRAESWLIVCGKEPARNAGKTHKTWHEIVHDGVERAGATQIRTEIGTILRLSSGHWPETQNSRRLEKPIATHVKEDPLLVLPTPSPQTQIVRLSPSDLGGAKVLGGGALNEAAALRRGRQIHTLLEHLPGSADAERIAGQLMSKSPDKADPDEVPGLLREAQRNIAEHPKLFAADALAEVDIAAMLPTLNGAILGTIDRLLVAPDRILAVDFKTNAVVPSRPEETPEGLMRQMGAYLEALEQIWPDTPIEVAILWTTNVELMVLPHGIVREALHRSTTS